MISLRSNKYRSIGKCVPTVRCLRYGNQTVGNEWNQTQLLSLTLRGVVTRDIESGDGKYPSDFGTYQLVFRTTWSFAYLTSTKRRETVGLSAQHGMITGAYDVFWCNADGLPAFIHYYYLHLDSFKGLRPYYTGLRKVVRPSTFLSIKLPLPPLSEQAAIAGFLDRETSKIDSLVGEQRRLIELLKEKRQAVISHAVTKGLNPQAPLKPSGIQWLGDVPEHWELKPLKYIGQIISGFAFKSEAFTDAGVRVLKIANIQTYNLDWSDESFVPESFYEEHQGFAVLKVILCLHLLDR